MRASLLILAALLVLTFTIYEVNAKTNTKQKDVKNKKVTKNTEGDNQEVQEEKPVFEKARIRYTKPKTDTRATQETRTTKGKKQDTKQTTTNKKSKTVEVARDAKIKYKQAPQEQVQKPKKLKKQEKYTRAANTEELQETVVPEPKPKKDKRAKRETATLLVKEKLKKVQREEAGVEEQSEEICPPCDCSNRNRVTEYLSNNAEEDVTTIEIETEAETDEQTQEETDENLQCDSLVEGCDV